MKRSVGRGYQHLDNEFFDLAAERNIYKLPQLLYVHLRGLYCRFQNPIFYCHDKDIRKRMGISQNALSSARQCLRDKELIRFVSGKGRMATNYCMLGSALLPELRVSKNATLTRTNKHVGYIKKSDTYNKSNEREMNKEPVLTGISGYDRNMPTDCRDELKRMGLLKA